MQANASNGSGGQYLTVEELASVLKVSERQIRYWLAAPESPIPHRRPSPGVVRFVLAEVDEWMRARTPEPTRAGA
jgi:excisionase family DNA binding protein